MLPSSQFKTAHAKLYPEIQAVSEALAHDFPPTSLVIEEPLNATSKPNNSNPDPEIPDNYQPKFYTLLVGDAILVYCQLPPNFKPGSITIECTKENLNISYEMTSESIYQVPSQNKRLVQRKYLKVSRHFYLPPNPLVNKINAQISKTDHLLRIKVPFIPIESDDEEDYEEFTDPDSDTSELEALKV